MIGRTVSHYKIVEQLGGGGMGVVYKAQDTQLKRYVALKFLPPEWSRDPEAKKRFQHEAQAASALEHNNICNIHEIGETEDGQLFIVMAAYEGETLKKQIEFGPLPAAVALDIAIQVGEGLAKAHEVGFVHRDIKPANIFVTKDGGIKILDFGLARLAGQTHLTKVGTTLGTIAYMSPQQTRAEDVDAQSDIWSLGVVLYEMLSGQQPFKGGHEALIIHSIRNEEAEPLAPHLPGPFAKLDSVVRRALEKDTSRRYPTVREFLADLRSTGKGAGEISTLSDATATVPPAPPTAGDAAKSRIEKPLAGRRRWMWMVAGAAALAVAVALWLVSGSTDLPTEPIAATTAPEHTSIAVLPFVNMSSDEEQEYFSDGISEELLNLLAKIPQLRVTSRSSAFSFKGQSLEIPEIARRLNVAHILEGSVRKAGNQVRITAQLIEAGSDTQLWSETYNRTLDDIFAIQYEIAVDVVTQLKVVLLTEVPTVEEIDPEAYALTLQARYLRRLDTAEGYEKAIELLQQALALDSDSAAAWTELAAAYANQTGRGLRPFDEGYRLAREAANKALAIDPDHAPAHARLGWIARDFDRDLAAAARHLERAIRLEPSNADILIEVSRLARSLGRLDESIALGEYLVARDPVSSGGHIHLGYSYYLAQRLEEAIASYRTALTLSPGRIAAHALIGRVLLQQGELEAALDVTLQEPLESVRLIELVSVYHALGRKAESDAALSELITKHEQGFAYDIAYVLAYRSEADRAFEWLDKAVAYNDPGFTELMIEPLFENLHSDPRWLPFLEKIGKAPEQLAAIEFKVTLPVSR